MRTSQTPSEETNVYRRGERTALCAVCHGSGQRTASAHDCPGCGIPLCPEHTPAGRRVCADCAAAVVERQENWGFASTRLMLLFWATWGALLVTLTAVLTRGCGPGPFCLHHALLLVTLVVLAVLLVCLFAVAAGYRSGEQGDDEDQSVDERVFARERRRTIVRRRVRRASSPSALQTTYPPRARGVRAERLDPAVD